MMEADRKAARRDAFMLSMVDLFGCGFIAAILLFVLNVIQPEIDTEEASSAHFDATSDQVGNGEPGPVFVSVTSSQMLASGRKGCVELPMPPLVLPSPEAPSMPSPEARFRYAFILEDVSAVKWPYILAPCLKDPDVPATLDVQLTFNGETVGMGVAGWNGELPLAIKFALKPALSADVDRDWPHALRVVLLADRSDRTNFTSRFFFRSPKPINAAIKWSGKVVAVDIINRGFERERITVSNQDADCTVVVDQERKVNFAYCGSIGDWIPDPASELGRSTFRTYPAESCWARSLGTNTCPENFKLNCAQTGKLYGDGKCGPLSDLDRLGRIN